MTSIAGTEKDEHGAAETEAPSKSARKRTAQAAQQLGEELIELRDTELDALGLPERLTDAIRAARGIRSRGAGLRQRQYIGRLMREIDAEALRGALAARHRKAALEAQRFQLLESWRERLIEEARGIAPGALDDLARGHPQIDRQAWRQAIAAARAERDREGGSGGASRQLFRMLRTLLDSPRPNAEDPSAGG